VGEWEDGGVDLRKDRAKPTWRERADGKQFSQWSALGKCQGTELVSQIWEKLFVVYNALYFMGRKDTVINLLEYFHKICWGFLHSPPAWDMCLQLRLSEVNLLHLSFVPHHRQMYLGCSKCTSSTSDPTMRPLHLAMLWFLS